MVVLEKSVGGSLWEKEKETSAGFIYLLVLFITFANLLSDEQLYHRVKVNNILRGFTSLFSANDFLFLRSINEFNVSKCFSRTF
jgi:hypothetical protein